MKKYKVKVGNMYLRAIYLDEEYAKTEFIKDIDLSSNESLNITILEDERELYRNKLANILNLSSGNIYDIITFEEVEENNE